MLNKRALLASSAVAVLSSVGSAQAGGTFYVGINAGANWQNDRSATGTTNFFPGGASDTVDPNTGFVLGAALGVHLDQWLRNLRAEIEATYRRNELDGHWSAGSVFLLDTSGSIDGHLSTFAVLANIWYDIDVGSKFVPYIGGGAGWGRSKFDGIFRNDGTTFVDENSGFVYQLGAGVNYEVQDGVRLGAGYRYFRGPNVKSNVFLGKNGNINLPVPGENDNHSVVISLTIDTN